MNSVNVLLIPVDICSSDDRYTSDNTAMHECKPGCRSLVSGQSLHFCLPISKKGTSGQIIG